VTTSTTTTTATATPRRSGAPAGDRLYRHPSDVARLVFNLVLLTGFVLVAVLEPDGVKVIGADVLRLVDNLPRSLVEGLVGVVQFIAVVAPVVIVVILLYKRRVVLLLILLLAAAIAAVLMAVFSGVVQDAVPVDDIDFERFSSWFVGGQFPSSTYLAGATAVFVAGSPWLSRAWRRAGWIFIAATVAARVLSATEVPLRIGMMLTLGAASGSLALLAFGAPRRRIDVATVAESTEAAGLGIADIETYGDVDHGVPKFTGVGPDGRLRFIKVMGRDERDSNLLISAWRALTRRGLGDDVPKGSPRRVVEHEALALAIFRAADVEVPQPLAAMPTRNEAAVLVTTSAEGVPLATLAADDIDDALLVALWGRVRILQSRRLAHRALSPANVLVGPAGPVLVDLRRADIDASDEVLGADVAELLASLTVIVGADRAIASARAGLTTDQLIRAVPLLQPAVFTPHTRRSLKAWATAAGLKDDKRAAEELRDRLADAAGIEHVQLAPINRITLKGIVSLVGSMVLGYYIISLAANWEDIWESFQEANLLYVIPVIVLAMATYFTGAMSLLGAVTIQLAFMRTTAVMFGQSFLNRFTPANAGGMAMRMRYLQLNGQDTTVAAASIGLTSAASGMVQGVLIVVFLVWGGSSDSFSDFQLPDFGTIAIIMLVVGGLATALLFTRWGRTTIRPWLGDAIRKVRTMFGDLARAPGKMAMLFGGALLGKLCNIVAFWLSCLAFDVDISFPKAGALFMIANTIGSAVPTPGGVGGIEAALTGVLIGFGVDSATAAAIVLFFRILTFWLPTLPGYGFLQYTQRKGIV
jgi:uncharacterized membrane protein YbhN (UPF0104 family)/serine/threonine-protein kinase RIO1